MRDEELKQDEPFPPPYPPRAAHQVGTSLLTMTLATVFVGGMVTLVGKLKLATLVQVRVGKCDQPNGLHGRSGWPARAGDSGEREA